MYESIAKKSLMDALQQVANEQIKKHKIETCFSVRRGRFYTKNSNSSKLEPITNTHIKSLEDIQTSNYDTKFGGGRDWKYLKKI